MIIVKLQGGLGNQMFQYAAARALAKQNNTSVSLDLSWFSQNFNNLTTPRHYELSCFRLDEYTSRHKDTIPQRLHESLARKYIEQHYQFDSNFNKLPRKAVLQGYFQSEKYFINIRSLIMEDFEFLKTPNSKNKQIQDDINACKSSVALHVRRGDYASSENVSKFHGLSSLDYYRTAVKIIESAVNQPSYYVFSDDPDWCKKNLKFNNRTTYIDWNTDGAEDLRLMKSCKHNIIANSSFSWWGAWLNTNQTKIVVAPKQWFNDPAINTNDVIPGSWQRI